MTDANPLLTFSVDYQEQARFFHAHEFQPDSDAIFIDVMSNFFSTQHTNVELAVDQLYESLADVVRARDMPGMADIDGSLLLFCREIKKHATVAVSGEAADELFGGYPWFQNTTNDFGESFPWATAVAFREEILSSEANQELQIKSYVKRKLSEALAETPELPKELRVKESAEERHFRRLTYLNITRFMPTLLDRKDRMSMASGLEVRVPFCDHELVEYAFRVPRSMKNHDGREKGLLREALRGILPNEVLWRKKNPYPKTHHPAYATAVRSAVLDMLSSPQAPILDWIDGARIRQFAESASATSNWPWFGQLMSGPQFFAYLLQVNMWLEHYRVRVV